MKRFLLCTATVLAMFGCISQADAKDPEDQEFRHVVVTLKSGEKSKAISIGDGMRRALC